MPANMRKFGCFFGAAAGQGYLSSGFINGVLQLCSSSLESEVCREGVDSAILYLISKHK